MFNKNNEVRLNAKRLDKYYIISFHVNCAAIQVFKKYVNVSSILLKKQKNTQHVFNSNDIMVYQMKLHNTQFTLYYLDLKNIK